VKELKNVANVAYKTLRYPTHYDYVRDAVERHHGDFDKIKAEFLKVFPFNPDDVIVVYAEAKGINSNGTYVRETFSGHYRGIEGMSAIRSTTAAGGVAILELMLQGKVSGLVNHTDISMRDFMSTATASAVYKKK
jgi:saccharopine dehydrogenase-like NADP-dependent oxidoreductase